MMKLTNVLNELNIEQPKPQNGIGIEITIDSETAEKFYSYYEIKDESKRKIPKVEFEKLAGPNLTLIETASRVLIQQTNSRRKFAESDPGIIDIVAFRKTGEKQYRVVATSDDGQLQFEYNIAAKKWVKK